MFGLSGDKVFQDAGTLSGGEKTKLALAMLMVGRQQPAAARRADQQPRPAVTSGGRRRARDWPGAIILVSHDTDFVQELGPTKVLLMPDGDVDYFSESWLDLVAMA